MSDKYFKGADERENLRLKLQQQLDIETSDYINDNDFETVVRIKKLIDELERLEENINNNRLTQADKERLLKDFKENYQPMLEAEFRLKDKKNLPIQNDNKKRLLSRIFENKFFRFAVISVFILNFCFFINNMTKIIAGTDILEIATNWTSDVFKKDYDIKTSSIPNIANDNYREYESIEEVEIDLGIDILPLKGIPKEFKLNKIGLSTESKQNIIRATLTYTNKDKFLLYKIRVIKSMEATPQILIEKTEDDAYIYLSNGIKFYVLENIEFPVITWEYNSVDYSLTGNVTKQELLDIINKLKI